MMTPARIISTQKLCKPLKAIKWECPSISLPPKSLPLRSAAEFPLPPSLLSGMLPSGLLHTQTAITWSDGKQKRIVIFLPCAILQNLFPILCISCGRRGEHHFVNGVTVLNSGTEASQKKTQQLVNLWL